MCLFVLFYFDFLFLGSAFQFNSIQFNPVHEYCGPTVSLVPQWEDECDGALFPGLLTQRQEKAFTIGFVTGIIIAITYNA